MAPAGAGPRVGGADGFDLGAVALLDERAGIDVAHGADVPGDAAGRDVAGRARVVVGHGEGARGDGEAPMPAAVLGARTDQRAGKGAHAVAGHERGEPPVAQLGRHLQSAAAQSGDPDRHAGGGRQAEAQRPGVGGVVHTGGLAGEQRADGGHRGRELVDGMGERDVVKAFGQGSRTRAEAEDVATARDLVEGRGGHREGARGPAPDGQNARDQSDPRRGQRDLGQHRAGVEPPAFGQRDELIPQLVGQPRGPDHHVPPGLHGGDPHPAALGCHDTVVVGHLGRSFPGSRQVVTESMGREASGRQAGITPVGTSIRYLSRAVRPAEMRRAHQAAT